MNPSFDDISAAIHELPLTQIRELHDELSVIVRETEPGDGPKLGPRLRDSLERRFSEANQPQFETAEATSAVAEHRRSLV